MCRDYGLDIKQSIPTLTKDPTKRNISRGG